MEKSTQRSWQPSSRAKVQVDLTFAIFRDLLGTVIVGCIGLIGATAMIAYQCDDRWMWGLVKIMGLVCAGRIATVTAFQLRSKDHLTVAAARWWECLYSANTFVYCATMSAATLHNFRYHDIDAAALCILGTFCLCTGLSARAGMRPWVLQLCGLLMLAALAFSSARSSYPLVRFGTVLICLFAYAYCQAVSNQFQVAVEQLESRRKLRSLAEQDPLTGLANRRHFQQTLKAHCLEPVPFAILYLDLDRFKKVNDELGHAAGDTLLQLVAERLRACMRATDFVARLGGDEFAIIQTPVIQIAAAEKLAERINNTLATAFEIDGEQVFIGASIGIRIAEGSTMNANQLLRTADEALYRVKKAGGGSFLVESGEGLLEAREGHAG